MIMQAKYPGRCAVSGRSFSAGSKIDYDRRTKRAVLVDADGKESGADGVNLAARTRSDGCVSNVFNIGGREFYRNKRGTCEDAPCCGCCTI